MKRAFSFLISLVILIFSHFPVLAEVENRKVSVSAEAYVLYCPDNKQVILSKNSDSPMGMASTTKIMTSLLALEYAQKNNKTVEFTSAMQAEGSSMYLKVSDKVRLSDLAAGMMTVSGNDAANATAFAMAGDKEKFAALMNARAKEIGMKNTCFKNPSGLTEEGHYSTVYDMALLMAEAMENKDFRKLAGKKSVTIEFIEPQHQIVTYNNHNRLLQRYEYCIGGKTGFTKASGRCLVTCSEKDNLRLIAVTFNAPSDWQDHINLYDYGFGNLSARVVGDKEDTFSVNIMGSSVNQIKAGFPVTKKYVSEKETVSKTQTKIYISPVIFAPVKKGEIIGKAVCTLDDKVICENNILAQEDAGYINISFFMRFLRSLFK